MAAPSGALRAEARSVAQVPLRPPVEPLRKRLPRSRDCWLASAWMLTWALTCSLHRKPEAQFAFGVALLVSALAPAMQKQALGVRPKNHLCAAMQRMARPSSRTQNSMMPLRRAPEAQLAANREHSRWSLRWTVLATGETMGFRPLLSFPFAASSIP